MNDSIEYELLNWEPREVWRCQGGCGKYRHRRVVKGILPAVCCGVPAKLIDRYQQPTSFEVNQVIESLESKDAPKDEELELAMARMQAASLFFPEPTEGSEEDA
jgi:predicted metal-binding protein